MYLNYDEGQNKRDSRQNTISEWIIWHKINFYPTPKSAPPHPTD